MICPNSSDSNEKDFSDKMSLKQSISIYLTVKTSEALIISKTLAFITAPHYNRRN